MESTRIMDRLICGDVGYGKTEVALRAAFKEVQESRQVAYLAPTTILAQQIYNTFVQRMKEFPVRVELLCRFRTPAQQKKAIEDLKKGQVDVIIGTHRILSKDVQFKNLGLLIVDEEQRFGVTHKEKIKQLKKDVDVLTLTATPIPRTLHMSLIGIRDMSVLEEPPMDRMPIQTYVMEYDEETVREAINRELRRGGQVYYVYNRVTDIADVALRIAKLVPDARVDFADENILEDELLEIQGDEKFHYVETGITYWQYKDTEGEPSIDSNGKRWNEAGYLTEDWKEAKGSFGSYYGELNDRVGGKYPSNLLNYYSAKKKALPVYYFRTEFEVDDAREIFQLSGEIQFDDSVIIYLNGKEIYKWCAHQHHGMLS